MKRRPASQKPPQLQTKHELPVYIHYGHVEYTTPQYHRLLALSTIWILHLISLVKTEIHRFHTEGTSQTNTYPENKTGIRPITPPRSLKYRAADTNRNVKCYRMLSVPTTMQCRLLFPTAGHYTVNRKRPSAWFRLWPLRLLLFVCSCRVGLLSSQSVGSDNHCHLKYTPCSFCSGVESLTIWSKHRNVQFNQI